MGPELIVTEFLKDITLISNYIIKECETIEDLDKLRVILVGKNGILTSMQKEIGQLIKEDRLCQQQS